jgi:copper chaperone
MKKVLTLGFALLAFAAFISLPNAAYACGAEKSNTTKSASVDKTNAKMASAKGGSCYAPEEAIQARDMSGKSACAAKSTEAKTASADNAIESKYSYATMAVKGMTCGGCEKSVTAALEHVNGVVGVKEVSYKSGQAVVEYDPAKCQEASLTKAVANKGYEAEIIPAVATSTSAHEAVCPVTGKTCTDAQKAACAAKEAKSSNSEATAAAASY